MPTTAASFFIVANVKFVLPCSILLMDWFAIPVAAATSSNVNLLCSRATWKFLPNKA